jgi:hypothetical protein
MTLPNTPSRARIVISPQRPLPDTVLHIRLLDLPSDRLVTVRATRPAPHGHLPSSTAVITARADGTTDLHRDAPIAGSYPGTDPMGPIWSMEASDEPLSNTPAGFLAPTPLTVIADIDGEQVSAAQVQGLRVPDGLARTEVREHGLFGTLYQCDDDRVLPGVPRLGGAEGGIHEDGVQLLAAHGYTVLALAYAGMPGLPATLQDIALEYFDRALRFLGGPAQVDRQRLAVVGASKGGEVDL